MSRLFLIQFKQCCRLVAQVGTVILLSACSEAVAPTQVLEPPPLTETATELPHPTPMVARPTQAPTAAPSQTPIPVPAVCSPFPGYSELDLLAAVSNRFNPPALGSDDPHQAVDLAVIQDGIALAGGPVQAVLEGQVALVIQDRFPYGNAILIETPLNSVSFDTFVNNWLPTPAPTLGPHPSLTCPAIPSSIIGDGTSRSLYLLYAHLQAMESFRVDDPVNCGDRIGSVGQSGNALNPHLHLELRVGPAGVRFSGMAHYDSSAKLDEMGSYCLWRVSNLFQLLDPNKILEALP